MRALLTLLLLASWGLSAAAAEFRSVDAQAAILYDAPSAKGKKLYLIKPLTPVEVLVKLDGWVKVRDAEGTLAWVQARALTEKRMLVVTSPKGEIRQAERPDAPLVAELDKWVAVELIEPGAAGWAKVRHRDGATGYMRLTQVWGL
ncbi:SH3 domain-containing protein [Dechloromonas sp. ZS-1]|uniref:SH3 domain-containing protein n=1 Tax=Dechloromonas sp. ZS-1 TaxID=3138067 RepID=UPI0031FCAB10